jgi:hypothetical protein
MSQRQPWRPRQGLGEEARTQEASNKGLAISLALFGSEAEADDPCYDFGRVSKPAGIRVEVTLGVYQLRSVRGTFGMHLGAHFGRSHSSAPSGQRVSSHSNRSAEHSMESGPSAAPINGCLSSCFWDASSSGSQQLVPCWPIFLRLSNAIFPAPPSLPVRTKRPLFEHT